MSKVENIIAIKILDRTYNIKCLPEEAQDLQESARYVDEQMRKLRQSSSITNTDRIAVVTALNICHELLVLKKQQNQCIDSMNERIHDMQQRIQNYLAATDDVAV